MILVHVRNPFQVECVQGGEPQRAEFIGLKTIGPTRFLSVIAIPSSCLITSVVGERMLDGVVPMSSLLGLVPILIESRIPPAFGCVHP
jgi:hypothetical protein